MNRTEAIKVLRGGQLSTDVFNTSTPYPFRVIVRAVNGRAMSHLSYHPTASQVRLSPLQLLSFIKRNFPR